MTDPATVNINAVKSEIRAAIINPKANACPMAVRVAWHASGTYDSTTSTGGSNGATTRFEPESTDPANAGLSIIRDLLHPIHVRNPNLSQADLWTLAGASAVEFLGGPAIPHKLGRTDAPLGAATPPNGRLPDASQGAQHLRDVFYRMGFNDRDIVALSGAHTLGRCHLVRSGFDGKWTSNPLVFDNSYFKNLMSLEWRPKKVEASGNMQFEATDATGDVLMMLPTDMALKTDPVFAQHAAAYAADQQLFFKDFSDAFSRLLAAGCPAMCNPQRSTAVSPRASRDHASAEFREWAMHGSLEQVRRFAPEADVHALERSSGRSALHKAAYWGHDQLTSVLLKEYKLDPNVQDNDGDSALHDAARFGHIKVCQHLVAGGCNKSLRNKAGQTARDVAEFNGKNKFQVEKANFDAVVQLLGPSGKL